MHKYMCLNNLEDVIGAHMMEKADILWLEEIRKEDIAAVGGKGASLGEMAVIGLPVPRAFIVTSYAFRRFLIENQLEKTLIKNFENMDVENNAALEHAAELAKDAVMKASIPSTLGDHIREAYQLMDSGGMVVAVRSSATAEDLPDASFAGQQETYLNIKGINNLLTAVQMCWASLYGARAIYYRSKQGFDDNTVNIAVVVQQLVNSEKAGVMFTNHPVTGEPLTMIEGSWGLGESVVSGSVSPDKYIVDQRAEKVIDRMVSNKKIEIIAEGTHGTKTVPVSPERQDMQVLSDEEVLRLAMFGKIAGNHYGIPQDIEWAIVGKTFYILQSRPITTIKQKITEKSEDRSESGTGAIIVRGQGASPGIASGKVVIVRDAKDTSAVSEGDIMVTKMTNPDMVPAMKKVSAIVTDEGGMTCHAAIVSRELGTPAIVGTKTGTTTLQPGQLVTVDGEKGFVYEGANAVKQAPLPATAVIQSSPVITATSVKVNVSIPEAATRAAATGADGVGLLRIEHLILGLGKTPGWYITNHKETEFVQELYDGIKIVLDAFYGKPVWVRTLDAPTDEFRNMAGGENEPIEHNPMLGWRGIRRDLQSPGQFRLQVEAFLRLWEDGYSNLGVMFPMVSHPDQFIDAKSMMKGWGVDVDHVALGIMIEIPASAILIREFIDAGINFASFGTNDLVQYTLAIDRNNENVAWMADSKHPAVLSLIHDAIQTCNEYEVECSICGQAGSEPSMVQWLVEHGISSVSANIDAIAKIRETVARTERKIILESARSRNV